jgi:hypothetical protein
MKYRYSNLISQTIANTGYMWRDKKIEKWIIKRKEDIEEKLPYPICVIYKLKILCGYLILLKVNNTTDLYQYTKY